MPDRAAPARARGPRTPGTLPASASRAGGGAGVTVLLQASFNYRERGMDTLLFTPCIDTRVALGKIASRIGLEANAVSFDDRFDFFEYVRTIKLQKPNLKCILIDEGTRTCTRVLEYLFN